VKINPKKRKAISLIKMSVFILVILSISLISAFRLPTVGGDNSTWGTVLNDYLTSLAGANATSLNETMVDGKNVYESAINTTHILDGTITDADLSDSTDLTLNQKITFALGETISNAVNGWITIGGNANMTGNLQLANITATGYFEGQPITGSIGSGIIWANGTNSYAEVEITCSSLNCSWNAFKVRLVNTSNIEKYCDIPAGSKVITDNQQSVLYIDNNCQIQEVSVQTYVAMSLSPGGIADFANIIAENGEVYNVNGLGIENKRIIKLRTLLFRTMHLSVLTGFNKEEGTFPQFNITAGSYVYLMDVVSATKQNTTTNHIETISHVNSTSWGSSEKTGLNYTYCDTETGTVLCTDTGKYRRIFMFLVGYNDSTDTTHLHQLLPSQTTTYTKLSDCLDILKYPVTYTLPSFYQYGGVMLYAYCARPSDIDWTSGWIDLRTVKQSTATGGIDTSIFVTTDGTRVVAGNFNATGNITSSSGFKINNSAGLTGNYSLGECWQKFTGGILIATNCTIL